MKGDKTVIAIMSSRTIFRSECSKQRTLLIKGEYTPHANGAKRKC
jgi:hypothetical protein